MVSKGITPSDFGADGSLPINDQFMEEETDAFRNLMQSQNTDQQRIQEEARKQVADQEDALKQIVQKEEMQQAGKFEDREKGIEEEDAKKTTEEEDSKASEERRQAAVKKGAQRQAGRFEQNAHLVEESSSAGLSENREDVESENLSMTQKQKQTRLASLGGNKDSSAELDHSLRDDQKKIANKARLDAAQKEGQAAEKKPKKGEKSAEKVPIKEKGNTIQSIAANMALQSQPIQATSPQKSNLETQSTNIERRKEWEQLAKQITEEAEILKKGDEIRTTITVDLPDSIFNKGKITVSTFKYRPLEVNLKFENFSGEGTRLIKQNQGELKNVLKINSLNVHQLDVIE